MILLQLVHLEPNLASFQQGLETFDLRPEESLGPLVESAFYAELAARSVLAVENMKRGESESLSLSRHVILCLLSDNRWSFINHTKCADFKGEPLIRSAEMSLATALAETKVSSSLSVGIRRTVFSLGTFPPPSPSRPTGRVSSSSLWTFISCPRIPMTLTWWPVGLQATTRRWRSGTARRRTSPSRRREKY